jgi:ubiquinone/menaquinone biosynthesis C-methylase UbiE
MPDFLKVEEVLANLDITETMSGAEFGCGSAVFTMSMAKKMHKGRVYALDVQEEKLSALKGRMLHEKVGNITTVLADLEAVRGSGLEDNLLDVVLIPNVLFQAENKYAMIVEGARITKKGGQLLIIDWLPGSSFSPKEGMIKPEEMKEMVKKAGLVFKKEWNAGDFHYAQLFIK